MVQYVRNMALVIRLTRLGKKGEHRFRIVVKEKRSRRDGTETEVLGWYERREKSERAELKRERIAYWISKGALPSETVKKIIKL
jgi:small subunit ribosomal protein S16